MLHVISGLTLGGAEVMLASVARRLHGVATDHEIVSLSGIGPVGARLQKEGLRVEALGMNEGLIATAGAAVRLARAISKSAPDVIQTWMYQADLIGGLIAKSVSRSPIVWGIHRSDPNFPKLRNRILAKRVNPHVGRFLPRAIVCCGEESRRVHVAHGYPAERCVVIPNGFDVDRFAPNDEAAARFRHQHGIAPDAPVVGMVGRLDAAKDHRNFFHAAAVVAAQLPSAVFVMCGDGVSDDSPRIRALVQDAGISSTRLRLLGPTGNMEAVYPAFTTLALSSYTEGLPLVVGEAMACGVPCVVTDVGDVRRVVSDTGIVVPPRQPAALANGITKMLSASSNHLRSMGAAARRRIIDGYSERRATTAYERLYLSVVNRAGEAQASVPDQVARS